MESNQPRVEEVASGNIAERELQPPKPLKRKKKKVSFAVWWELHKAEELKKSAENIEQQDSSVVVENESITNTLETVDQKGDMQPPQSESNEKNQGPFKTWSEEHVPASLKEESYSDKTLISTSQLVTKDQPIFKLQKTLEQKADECPATGVPKENVKSTNLTEIPGNLTAKNIHGEKKTSPPKCACLATYVQSVLEHIEVQTNLMKQLDEMFEINQELNAELKQQKELTSKLLSERKQRRNSMISVQTQTDSQDHPKTDHHQSAAVQTEINEFETRRHLVPVHQTEIVDKTTEVIEGEMVATTQQNGHLEDRKKPSKNTRRKNRKKAASKASSELEMLNKNQVSVEINKHENVSTLETVCDQTASNTTKTQTKEEAATTVQQIIEKESVSETQQLEDRQEDKKTSKNSKRKKKRMAAKKAASQLKVISDENSSGVEGEQVVSTVGDQAASVTTETQTKEVITNIEQIIEKESVFEIQRLEDKQEDKKTSKNSKRKMKRMAAKKAASQLKVISDENSSGVEGEQVVSTVGDQAASVTTETQTKEVATTTAQQMIAEELTKSKCKKKRKMASRAELGFAVIPMETAKNLIEKTKIPKTYLDIEPEIPQTVPEDMEPKPGTDTENVTGFVPVVNTEGESGVVENQRPAALQPKVTINDEVVQTSTQEFKTQAGEELTENTDTCEEEERPMKKVSLWKRIKKALSPALLRRFKNRCKVHPL